MSTLVESGVPILYSLEISERSVDNLVLGDIIRTIKDDVRVGKPLGQALEKSNFFDPMAVQMINIGEEIGELSKAMGGKRETAYQLAGLGDLIGTSFCTVSRNRSFGE